jgi:hypothetical protein
MTQSEPTGSTVLRWVSIAPRRQAKAMGRRLILKLPIDKVGKVFTIYFVMRDRDFTNRGGEASNLSRKHPGCPRPPLFF